MELKYSVTSVAEYGPPQKKLSTLLCLCFWLADSFSVRWIELAKRMSDSMIGTKESLPFDNRLSAV